MLKAFREANEIRKMGRESPDDVIDRGSYVVFDPRPMKKYAERRYEFRREYPVLGWLLELVKFYRW